MLSSDAEHWRTHMPGVIEAVFGDAGTHRAFLNAYGLSATTHPLLHYNGHGFT